ncbi:MAG TPA: hypothetical protein VNM90_15220 [Haliangium sp.]|nr:hypothetical protein [Haliangium sp.]
MAFLAEARTTARGRHDDSVKIHDVGVHDDQPFPLFEHLRGQTPRQWMAARFSGAFDVRDSPG